MQRFIIKILLFSIIPIVYFGIVGLINLKIIAEGSPQISQARVLVVGDSHPQKAFSPDVFDSAINISQSAEPYLLTFWKLKKLLPLVKPDTVIIGFSHHNISTLRNYMFSDKQWSSEMFKRSYTIHEFETVQNIEIDYQEYYRVLWKQLCLFPHSNHYNYLEEYTNVSKSNISDSLKAIKRHYFYKGETKDYSTSSMVYLDSVLNTCLMNNVVPILITTPVHKAYRQRIPDNVIKQFKIETNRYKEQGLIVLDYTSQTNTDSLFLNIDHLNKEGAKLFTERLKRDLGY